MKNEMTEATYLPQVIEEYKDNPLIEALPPINLTREAMRLAVEPGYNEGERGLTQSIGFIASAGCSNIFSRLIHILILNKGFQEQSVKVMFQKVR